MFHTPTSIKVICILGIIFAGLVILITPLNFVLMFHPLTPNPMMDQLMQDRTYVVFVVISDVLNILFAAVLLAGSIASLKLKPWGRKAMLFYAWARVGEVILASTMSLVFVVPKFETVMTSNPALAGSPIAGILKIATVVGVVVGVLFSLAMSAVLIYFFNRKVAKDAFNGIFVPPASAFPVGYDEPLP